MIRSNERQTVALVKNDVCRTSSGHPEDVLRPEDTPKISLRCPLNWLCCGWLKRCRIPMSKCVE